MSPDPYDGSYDIFNPQSLNRYSYVLNNPLALVDSLGMEDPSGCDNGDDDGDGGCNPGGDQSDPGGNPSSTGIDNTANGYRLHIHAYGFTGPDLNDLTSVRLSSIYSFQFNGPFTFQIGGGALSSGCMVVNGTTVCHSPLGDKLNPMERGKRTTEIRPRSARPTLLSITQQARPPVI